MPTLQREDTRDDRPVKLIRRTAHDGRQTSSAQGKHGAPPPRQAGRAAKATVLGVVRSGGGGDYRGGLGGDGPAAPVGPGSGGSGNRGSTLRRGASALDGAVEPLDGAGRSRLSAR